QFNFSDSLIATYGGDRLDEYVKKMQTIPNLDARCLVPEGDTNFPAKHCVYKWLRKVHKDAIPYFLYGNKVAVLASGKDEDMSWVSISSESLSKAYLNHFDVYWEQAESAPVQNRSVK
ncbi:MAG: hypothetical protein AB7H77_04580, partial [Bdellovibrionales bacterium]